MKQTLQNTIRIGIIHEYAMVRTLLKDYLSEQANFELHAVCDSTQQFMEHAASQRIDVLLFDYSLPSVKIADELRHIKSELPGLRIILLSAEKHITPDGNLLAEYISGYASAAISPEDLFDMIRRVAEERLLISQQSAPSNTPAQLTEREIMVLQMLWEEKTNREIAEKLFLSVKSIEKMRLDIKEKLSAHSLIGMLKKGLERQIISIGEEKQTTSSCSE
ncbi:response regulator transcription factor [Chitinophaga rhizophila]|uniref:Response regulator transcription factor n=1 Tax=Chitinophaga rhizophila TaxID=2866212 RepID=A0ABS7G5X6_9BACT|nr:response regulator transcription factor [Chitinophaga rhizophila]MBW8683050.1 response regulator transcription factor [Chitinophaga rhizophila]